MKVGIIGSGGREHALCHAIKNSKKEKSQLIADNLSNISNTTRSGIQLLSDLIESMTKLQIFTKSMQSRLI